MFLGLPVILTAQLLIVVRRLWKKCGGMALKQPDLADTLGMTSVLMTDKSGALTCNSLQVTDLWCGRKFIQFNDFVEVMHKPEKSKKMDVNPLRHDNNIIKTNDKEGISLK